MNLFGFCVLVLAGMGGVAGAQSYSSTAVDASGQLSITLSTGAVVTPPKLQDQVSFSQVAVSGDHRLVGWLVNYADSSAPQGSGDPIAGRLVIYRAGRVRRSFPTGQIFWSWRFVHRGRDVAFCTGPTHGGASGCELHRVASGAVQAKWDPHAGGDAPSWLKGMSY